MKNRKGQIAPTTVITIIIAVVVLVAIILFFTGRFQTGTQQVSQLTPGVVDAATTACRIACESANSAVQSSADGALWETRWCDKQVIIGGQAEKCWDPNWGPSGNTVPNPLGRNSCKFAFDPPGSTYRCTT